MPDKLDSMHPANSNPKTKGTASADAGPMGRDSAESLARILKAIGDPTRLQLLSMILAKEPQGVTVGGLVAHLEFQQPTISHHLKILHDAAIVNRVQEGRTVTYSLAEEFRDAVADILT